MLTNEKISVAVLVSGGGTNLQAILDAEKRGEIPSGRVSLVLSDNPNAYALQRAKTAGIKTAVVAKTNYPSLFERENAMQTILQDEGIELIVLAGYLSILSENFTKAWEERIVNVHPSLIPSFCGKGYYGLKVHEAALSYGVKVTGATVHYVNEIPDGGKIILQKAVEIEEGDTPERLQKRVMEQAEWKILPKAVQIVCEKLRKEKEQ